MPEENVELVQAMTWSWRSFAASGGVMRPAFSPVCWCCCLGPRVQLWAENDPEVLERGGGARLGA